MDMEIDDDTSRPKGDALAFEHSFYLGFLFIWVTKFSGSVMFEGKEEKGKPIMDTLGNGKAGIAQCLKSAANALEDGKTGEPKDSVVEISDDDIVLNVLHL
ncbi:hypothetical protein FNV43_RR08816 [Rhamnella rubrinervis]|uniref:Uncharacterized protein n=1 Tax=Rhamnella rubrinervis TaxID=2594499 RepID=A0A8K0H9A1_9ROSA|nr:hypothetical protein FNV43_RR08816 [Rhamnella rubrinervis]